MVVFSGIISAIVSYLCNIWALKREGNVGITVLVPFIEEFSKTMSAILIGTSIVGTHFVFGIIEGIYDIATSSKSVGKLAALASIISHSIFGFATYYVIRAGYPVYWGIFLAWLIHSTWNWYITKYL